MDIPFQLNLSLINHFRTFQQENHDFTPFFLETVLAQYKDFLIHSSKNGQEKTWQEKMEEKLKNEDGIKVEHIALMIHFYFASIANLEDFIKCVDQTATVASLTKSHVNKTNIMNVHPIVERLGKITEIDDKFEVKNEYLNYNLALMNLPDEKKLNYTSKDYLAIDFDLLLLGIKAKGKLDPYLVSYICSRLNVIHSIQLFSIVFVHMSLKKDGLANLSKIYADVAISILVQHRNFSFSEAKFEQYVKRLVNYKDFQAEKKIEDLNLVLNDIENDLCHSLIESKSSILNSIETLLIGMLGHPELSIRDAAVQYLNVLYDGVDWQLRTSFKPKVACVGDSFKIEYLIESLGEDNGSIVLLLNSRSFCPDSNENIITWHRPKLTPYKSSIQIEGSNFLTVSLDLGKFIKCGFYDWKLVRMEKSGKIKGIYKISNMDDIKSIGSSLNLISREDPEKFQKSKPVHGRVIVHPAYTRQLQIHEVFVDFQEGMPDPSGKMARRGNFRKVKDNMKRYRDSGINCMYLMGALERDNGIQFDKESHQNIFKRPDVSPLAVTCRKTPNKMLGGPSGFSEMIDESKKLDMKIIIDGLTRVSSARPHRRYMTNVLNVLDQSGKKTVCFGTDGKALNFEDTALLNYRKKETWDLFLQEVMEFTDKFHIDGIHLDNGQAWPQIMMLDIDEMYRLDPDGIRAYTDDQIFNGEVVIQDEKSGFWGSSVCDKYPNPFLVKITKTLWSRYKEFFILAESMSAPGFEGREISIIRSGPIPRVYSMPYALATILGQKLHPDGSITHCERKNVNIFKSWYDSMRKFQPDGSLVVQSTTSHSWPYPALLYKRGTWAAVDLIFFLPDIPMTFIGEQDGHAFRSKTTNIFTKVVVKDQDLENEKKMKRIQTSELKQDNLRPKSAKSLLKNELQEAKKLFGPEGDISQAKAVIEKRDVGGNLIKVASGVSISELAVQNIHQAETSLQMEIGPHFGFDLKKIREHYEHRRLLRQTKEVLRNGRLISLSAEHDLGWHSHVLAFARYNRKQIAIVAINFNDAPVHVYLNLKNLKFIFKNYENSDLVVKVEDWLSKEDKFDYFTVGELINDRHYAYVNSFQSILWGVSLTEEDTSSLQKLGLERSVKRLKNKIENLQTIYSNEITIQITTVLKNSKRLQDFLNGFSFVYNHFLKPNDIDLVKLIGLIRDIRDDTVLIGKFMAIFKTISELKSKYPDCFKGISAVDIAEQILESSKIGTIAFCTPELGRWSTVGGLGVMVDELSQGLASLGERVIMVSPYYYKNRKGETDYLAKDPIKIVHKLNFEVWMGGCKYNVGVHEGNSGGVQYFFLHSPEIFPYPYPDGDAAFTIKQLVMFGRGCLELFCQVRDIPKLIVTNDWFCGLMPGYAKCRVFGDVFDKTKFFHIVHNLDPMYEGRCYPKPEEGSLQNIHELPDDLLVDPYWSNKVLNPSRCAIMCSDQWGTVSQAYRQDLLSSSPLAGLLGKHQKPFGFPNGIPKNLRLKKLNEICGNDHLDAKRRIQQKYFNFQELDNSKCLMSFVGRITQQKGVHLICEMMDDLINKFGGKIQVLIGGMANMKDPYGAYCAGLIWNLKNKYPYNFWGNPSEFFTGTSLLNISLFYLDGTLINSGSDFGLMPSLFEPGGIVQHEFFVASTPVIAFKTGGLKDTVFEFEPQTGKGNGFNFHEHRAGELYYACERAMKAYSEESNYELLRKNAFESVIDVADVARAWVKEFHRLFGKLFVDGEVSENQYKELDKNWDLKEFKETSTLHKSKGSVLTEEDEVCSNFDKVLVAAKRANYKKNIFRIQINRLPRPKLVQIIGTWDNWKAKQNLLYDYFSQTWGVTMNLNPGEYFYKYIVDGDYICNDNDLKGNDIYGNINNYLVL